MDGWVFNHAFLALPIEAVDGPVTKPPIDNVAWQVG